MQSPASTSYRARLEQARSCAESHPGQGSPRFRACDITQCKLDSLLGDCQPGSQAIVVISTSDDCFFLLGQFVVNVIDQPRHSPCASCEVPLNNGRAAESAAVVAAEWSDCTPRTDVLCGKPLVLLRRSWREVVLNREDTARRNRLDDDCGHGTRTYQARHRDGPGAACQSVVAVDSRTAQVVILLGACQFHAGSSGQSLPRTGKCHEIPVVSI